jgi:DNA processing protein
VDLLSVVAVSMLPASRSRAAAAFKEIRHKAGVDPVHAVLATCGVPSAECHVLAAKARLRAREALAAGRAEGIEPIPLGDPQYPVLLSCIADPPPILWIDGSADVLSRPAVAIIGSRAASLYALQVGERLGRELADRGVVVVSGLARGVDSAAHRGCLEGDGRTVAVLGSGVNRVYPPEHRSLARQIREKGAVVSELEPRAAPLPEHFPLRNRIISGISLAVVVVEASEKSGSLITAGSALEQGRDVMAVPGSVLTGRNRGSHALLKDGAKVVETADDILEELGWPSVGAPSVRKSLTSEPILSAMEPGEVYRLEDLSARTGVAAPKLLARLMELELGGTVTGMAGGCFALSARSK